MFKPTDGVGYDMALYADTEAGPVEVGLSLDEQDGPQPTLAVFLHVPRLGRMVLALSFGKDGKLTLSSVARKTSEDEGFTQVISRDPASRIVELELKLVEERRRALELEERALAREEAAKTRLRELGRKNDTLSERMAVLERELAMQREVATSLQRQLHPQLVRQETPALTTPFDVVAEKSAAMGRRPETAREVREATAPYALEALQVARTVTLPDLEAALPRDLDDSEA